MMIRSMWRIKSTLIIGLAVLLCGQSALADHVVVVPSGSDNVSGLSDSFTGERIKFDLPAHEISDLAVGDEVRINDVDYRLVSRHTIKHDGHMFAIPRSDQPESDTQSSLTLQDELTTRHHDVHFQGKSPKDMRVGDKIRVDGKEHSVSSRHSEQKGDFILTSSVGGSVAGEGAEIMKFKVHKDNPTR